MPETCAMTGARELRWQVNGLQIAGLGWGDPDKSPLLAIHGWLDNATSFAMLAPLLVDHQVVALDLSGQGNSARRSDDASYQIWDDLPEIVGVLDQLGWQTFDLIGHSRGAIISVLLASAFPERVQKLVLLDAVVPEPIAEADFPTQLGKAALDKQRLLHRPTRQFKSEEDAWANRQSKGLTAEAARLIAGRNLEACEEGVRWSTDPRLTGASAVKLTRGQIDAVLNALSMPVLLLLASSAARRHPQIEQWARDGIRQLTIAHIDGSHQFHMEAAVTEVAKQVRGFLGSAKSEEVA